MPQADDGDPHSRRDVPPGMPPGRCPGRGRLPTVPGALPQAALGRPFGAPNRHGWHKESVATALARSPEARG